MNYRHIYHAGNGCDVVKHAALALLLRHLCAKPAPFAMLDTHAGCGLYDLADERALKTGEADDGVRRLLAFCKTHKAVSEIEPYLNALHQANGGSGSLFLYPGSPSIGRGAMREKDRLIACELHSEDIHPLRSLFRHDGQAQIHARDGYEALGAFLPFPEKRGLVLIDPPFEQEGEFDRLLKAAALIHARMPQAIAALWYPIKERPTIWRFHEALRQAAYPKTLAAEFLFQAEHRHDQLNGSGLIVLNAPWKLEEELTRLFAFLHQALACAGGVNQIEALTAL